MIQYQWTGDVYWSTMDRRCELVYNVTREGMAERTEAHKQGSRTMGTDLQWTGENGGTQAEVRSL